MSAGKYLTGSEFTVKEKIDADSQIATKYMAEDQDRTVVFESVNGGKAVGNLFSTRKKIADAMNIQQSDVVKHMIHAIDNPEDASRREERAQERARAKQFKDNERF